MAIIANTTLISNFGAANRLSLLRSLWDKLYISEQVLAEIQAGWQEGHLFYEDIEYQIYPLRDDGWLHLTTLRTADEFRLYGELLGRLHHGEASCLAIAHHRGWTFFSDDNLARQTARRLEIPVSGTLGALALLIERKVVTLEDGDGLLREMISAGYFSPVTSLRDLVHG